MAFGRADPTASGNLVVDRTGVGQAMNLRSSEDLSCCGVQCVSWHLSGFSVGEKSFED